MSALSLEKNGRISSSKRTKHMKAKYFLIKDYYESGEIDLRYCPTDIMWADVLTKQLQGQNFRDMQAFLQNCPRDYDDDIELQNDPLARQTMNHQVKTNVSSRECVGEHSKVETAKNVSVHFSKLPQQQPQIPAKSVVDGQAKLRAKQQTKQPSQPRGHPQATSPTCVSRVTWGPSQVVLIPDGSKGSHKGSYKGSHQGMSKGSHKESTKDWRRSAAI
jgi:hypothetical protein